MTPLILLQIPVPEISPQAVSKINPEAFKSAIASGNASPSVSNLGKSLSVPSSPKAEQVLFFSLPLYVPTGTSVSSFTAAAPASLQENKPICDLSFQKSVSSGCLTSVDWVHGTSTKPNVMDFPGEDLGAYGIQRVYSDGDIKALCHSGDTIELVSAFG